MLSNVFFLVGSIGTAVVAPNDFVRIGGLLLTTTASLSFLSIKSENLQRVVGKAGAAFASAANVALIANGQALVATGSTLNAAVAGTFLTAANLYYLAANVASLLDDPSVNHAKASLIAGTCILAAGLSLSDPALCGIGLCFTADGALRTQGAPGTIKKKQPRPS